MYLWVLGNPHIHSNSTNFNTPCQNSYPSCFFVGKNFAVTRLYFVIRLPQLSDGPSTTTRYTIVQTSHLACNSARAPRIDASNHCCNDAFHKWKMLLIRTEQSLIAAGKEYDLNSLPWSPAESPGYQEANSRTRNYNNMEKIACKQKRKRDHNSQ